MKILFVWQVPYIIINCCLYQTLTHAHWFKKRNVVQGFFKHSLHNSEKWFYLEPFLISNNTSSHFLPNLVICWITPISQLSTITRQLSTTGSAQTRFFWDMKLAQEQTLRTVLFTYFCIHEHPKAHDWLTVIDRTGRLCVTHPENMTSFALLIVDSLPWLASLTVIDRAERLCPTHSESIASFALLTVHSRYLDW